MNSLKPLNKKLAVVLKKPEEKSVGGIILSGNDEAPKNIGVVLAAGPEALCKPGDTVVFGINFITSEVNGINTLFMDENNVYSIIK